MRLSIRYGWPLLLLCAILKAQLSVPLFGVVRFSDGSVHAVHGVAANLIADRRTLTSADAASFSNTAGLISENGLIQLVRTDGTVIGEYQSGEPQPLLNIESTEQSAVAWLPLKHLLLGWNGKVLTQTAIDDSMFGGRVTFVRLADRGTAEFFVQLPDLSVAKVSVSLPSGQLRSSDIQPGISGRMIVQQDWVLAQNGKGLVAASINGGAQDIVLSEKALPTGDLTMERMSNDWWHVASKSVGTHWAVQLGAFKSSVFLIPPPVSQEAVR
jgi:hypothetical protein